MRLELTLRYPARVRSLVEAVRAAVTDDLARWAGYRMRTLAVTVIGLHAAVVVGYVSARWRPAELPRPGVRAGHTPPGEG